MIDLDFGEIAKNVGGFLDDYGMPLGLGLQGAGTLARRAALNRVEEERAARLRAHAARQRQIQSQMDAEMAKTIPQFTPQAQEAARQGIAGDYAKFMAPTMAVGDIGEYTAAATTGPAEVRDRGNVALAEARKKGADYATNLANITSYGGLDTQNAALLGRAGQNIGRLADSSRGYTSILPLQLDAASAKGNSLNLVADVANNLGNVAFMYGATAPKKPAQVAAPTYTGTGITMPQSGYLPTFGAPTGIDPKRANVGLRVPRM